MISRILTAAMALSIGLVMSVEPLDGQGRGNGNGDRGDVEQRDGDWGDILRGETNRRVYDERGNGAGKVPPGWCRGKGNPHNTVENCGYRSGTIYGSDRIDDRRTRGGSIDDRRARGGSYDEVHQDFHWELDRRYQELAARRPLDIAYQLELRARKQNEHQEWHNRMGIRH